MSYCIGLGCACGGGSLSAAVTKLELAFIDAPDRRAPRKPERERCEWAEVRLPAHHAAPRHVASVSRQPVPRRPGLTVCHRSRQVRLYVGGRAA